jgi:predicted SAM-dependent methyltransferase
LEDALVLTDKIRLNIGAGQSNLPGFVSLDIKTGTDASGKLPYADNSVDEVYASHVLEHIHHSKANAALAEWVRVLKPGGRIRIAVPNWDSIVEQHRNGSMSTQMLNAWLHGTDPEHTDRHQFVASREELEGILRSLAIENIESWEPEYEDCSRLPDSLNLGGYKRVTVINPKPRVALVLSTGRFGPTDFYHAVAELCRKKGWRLFQYGGDNWAKALTSKIREAIATENPDYILTLDFDSAFDADECIKIVDWMQQHPEVAAAWPVQAHRHNDLPLGFAWEAAAQGYYDYTDQNPWQGEFTQYGSGHFGCTAIRRQVFDTMPQPWFAGLPSTKTLDWDNDALDNDIAFWVGMFGHGFVFGQLNTQQIGHMELCVKWIVGDRIMWQPIQDWRKNGRPKNAVFDGKGWVKKAIAQMRKRLGLPPAEEPPQGSPELSAMPPPTEEVVAEVHRKAMDLNVESDVMTECERLAEQRRRSQPIGYQCGCGRPDPECQCGPRTVGEKEDEVLRASVRNCLPRVSTNMASYWGSPKAKAEVIDTAREIMEEKLRNASMANGRV